MARMFYSLEETAQKLGLSEEQVKEMASTGELQQFRDRDKLMFKREQIDALAPEDVDLSDLGDLNDLDDLGPEMGEHEGLEDLGDLDDNTIPLADDEDEFVMSSDQATTDTDVIDLISAGTGALDPSAQQPAADEPGTDAFETADIGAAMPTDQETGGVDLAGDDDLEDLDLGADTNLDDDELVLETIGSGSGLLDLTRETDDTSLGADLLDEIYPSDSLQTSPLDTQSTADIDATDTDMTDTGMVDTGAADTGMTDTGAVGTGAVGIGAVDQMDTMQAMEGLDNLDPMETAITSSSIFEGPAELDISTSGLENLQDIGEPSAVMPPPMAAPAAAEVEAEPFDFAGNALGIGMLSAALAALLVALIVMIYALAGVPSSTTASLAGSPLMFGVGTLAVGGVLTLIGVLFGKTVAK